MKLSDFHQANQDNKPNKGNTSVWDLIFVCLILTIASASFIYDSYLESDIVYPLKGSQINIK